ncbi:T9SS type A sorting domain-containing protein [Paraflavitalea speifideaquila]|uniref:T9SS type A sorting domain-containing protein n=1 Tax=Paraflavitalea speifideaquila TaxID=3076558 RepID=UPI0028E9C267|nr:T9SS type A sorting domain-containing protein [Paraflavitalea speifideiaquila]
MKSFSFSMASLCMLMISYQLTAQRIQVGPFNATAFSNNTQSGSVSWSNPHHAAVPDNNRAQATQVLSLFATVNTNYLLAQGWGIAIPEAATISGISIDVKRSAAGISLGGAVKDNVIKLIKNGSITGTNNASSTAWSIFDEYITYGSPTDNWGLSWTPGDINAGNFGVAIAASLQAGLLSIALSARIDHITITVYYLNPTTLPVTLERFTVTARNATNILNWAMADYETAARCMVNRSVDGSTWHTFATIHPQPNQYTYTFTDQAPPPGTVYYQLAIESDDGSVTYSRVQRVVRQASNIRFYPNPAINTITISGRRYSPIIVIRDLQGRLIKTLFLDTAVLSAQLSISGIPPGHYLLEIDGHVSRLQVAAQTR